MPRLLRLIAVFSLVAIHGPGVVGEETERDAVAPGWVMTRSFPAREAHQAAAADADHFYVINTGQGFAVDPAGRSGDLPAIVGINRAERLVITAQPVAAFQADSDD